MRLTKLLALTFSLVSSALFAEVVTPEMVLADGANSTLCVNPYTGESGEARKGTVAALLNNVARLNQLLQEEQSESVRAEVADIIKEIDRLVPSLSFVGMFDLFTPEDWFGDGAQPGRVVALSRYLKQYPEKNTLLLTHKFESIKEMSETLKALL